MGTTELIIIIGVVSALLVVGFVIIWRINRNYHRHDTTDATVDSHDFTEGGQPESQETLRTELRDKAREDLAKAVQENADFIKQDVRRTTSELNGYMQQEVTRALDEEINKFSQSTDELEKVAASSITRMQSLLDERYAQLSARVDEESAKEKDRIISKFEENMADVVGYYVTQALGNHLDVSTQLDYIIKELDDNKQAIVEDMRNA